MMIAAWAIVPCSAAPVEPRQRIPERRLQFYRRPFLRPLVGRPQQLPPLRIEPPDLFRPPPVERHSPLEEDQIPNLAPFSHGFHLTVPMRGDTRPVALASIKRYAEVGPALAACWVPPAGLSWSMTTLRLSFKRDGSVNGEPRIPYIQAGSMQQKSDLAHSLLDALKRCAPLPFSPSLGAAIAGEIFAISFTHQDRR